MRTMVHDLRKRIDKTLALHEMKKYQTGASWWFYGCEYCQSEGPCDTRLALTGA